MLPGGYNLRDKVFWTGASQTFPRSGNKLVHGQQGEVTGPTTLEAYKHRLEPLPGLGGGVCARPRAEAEDCEDRARYV